MSSSGSTREEDSMVTSGTTTGGDSPLLAVVLGTRPEIIKLAPILHECRVRQIPYILIHTGQHYSENLDSVFFDALGIPAPDHNLGVGSGPQGEQTGTMLTRVEEVLADARPDLVLVQGDTNSTLAGALAASKLHIPVGHVEAGLRSYDRSMPEEINRILTDHVSDFLFAPTEHAASQLRQEGLTQDRIFTSGNTVVDALEYFKERAFTESTVLSDLGLEPGEFTLLTVHRAENVDDPSRFSDILHGVDQYARETDLEVIYPIHPRSAAKLEDFGIEVPDRIRMVDPVDYFDFLTLESTASLVFTDSGGVQEETCILRTPCVTLRYSTERPESVFVSSNMVAGTSPGDIVEAGHTMRRAPRTWENPFGDGTAAKQIIQVLAPVLQPSSEERAQEDLVSD